jgi:hypothetical protein
VVAPNLTRIDALNDALAMASSPSVPQAPFVALPDGIADLAGLRAFDKIRRERNVVFVDGIVNAWKCSLRKRRKSRV